MFEGEVDAWLATSFAQNGRQGSKELPHGSPTSPELGPHPQYSLEPMSTSDHSGPYDLERGGSVLGRK